MIAEIAQSTTTLAIDSPSRRVSGKQRQRAGAPGDTARAESLAQDLNKRYLSDTQMQSLWLPAIHAQPALNRKNPALALNGEYLAHP